MGAAIGEDFVLSSAQSNVETVRKLSSCGANKQTSGQIEVTNESEDIGSKTVDENVDNSSSLNVKIVRQASDQSMIESPTISPLKARLEPLGSQKSKKRGKKRSLEHNCSRQQ